MKSFENVRKILRPTPLRGRPRKLFPPNRNAGAPLACIWPGRIGRKLSFTHRSLVHTRPASRKALKKCRKHANFLGKIFFGAEGGKITIIIYPEHLLGEALGVPLP